MIYIIHFREKLKHAGHYIGYVAGDGEDAVNQRLQEHRSSQGAKILAACNRQGIEYDIVRILPGDRKRERQLKQIKNAARYCPICKLKFKKK